MKIQGFSDEIYKISKGFPRDEAYGLTSQMKQQILSSLIGKLSSK
jgi:hypothetical protein